MVCHFVNTCLLRNPLPFHAKPYMHGAVLFLLDTQRISEAGSVQSRVSSASHGSVMSRASTALTSGTEGTEEEHADRHKKSYRKKRRASIMIEGTGKSFWIWDEDHPAREWAYWLVTHKVCGAGGAWLYLLPGWIMK